MSRELAIADYKISDDTDPFVIAEIGANHQGDVNLCESMFEAASVSYTHLTLPTKRIV